MDLDSLLKSIREENKGGSIVPAKFFGEDRYEKYLKEITASGTIDGESLTPEERREAFGKRNDKIDFQKFVDKVLAKKQSAPESVDNDNRLSAGGAIVKSPGGSLGDVLKAPSEETKENLDEILKGIDSILETLKADQKLEEKSAKNERRKDEKEKRSKKENKLESNIFKGIAKTVSKVLSPVKSLFDKIFEFLATVFLGRVAVQLFGWFTDDNNKRKVETIFKFIKDWWPALLGGLILFGGALLGPVGLIAAITGLAIGFIPKLVDATKQLLGFGKQTEDDATKTEQELKDVQSTVEQDITIDDVTVDTQTTDTPNTLKPAEEQAKEAEKTQQPTQMKGGGTVPGTSSNSVQTRNNTSSTKEVRTVQMKEGGTVPGNGKGSSIVNFVSGSNAKPVQLSNGGTVPGSGPNKDTVPAMLAPGEFVMSRGAVKKFGTNTLESMNAMGGGTNRPMIQGGKMYASGGGQVPPEKEPGGRNKFDPEKVSTMLTSRYGISSTSEPTTKINSTNVTNNSDTNNSNTNSPNFLQRLFGINSNSNSNSNSNTINSKNVATNSSNSNTTNLTDIQKQALQVLAKYESGAAGYDAVNQIGTQGGRGVMGFSGDIKKMPQHKGRSLTDFTIAEIKELQRDDGSMSNQQWIESGKLHAVGAYQFIGNTLPGVAQRAGIPDNAKFTPAVQDLLALQLMKERGISPWVGPSDKATAAERAIVEQARAQPLNFNPSISTGAIATAPGGSTSGNALGSGISRSSGSLVASLQSSNAVDISPAKQPPSIGAPSMASANMQIEKMRAMIDAPMSVDTPTTNPASNMIPQFEASVMQSSSKVKTLGVG